MVKKLIWHWPRFWMRVAGIWYCRQIATGLALLAVPPSTERIFLSTLNPRGWVDPRATLWGRRIQLGLNVFIDNRVQICQQGNGGPVEVGDRVRVHEDTQILVGAGGGLIIGADTRIQRGCQIESYKAPIRIGCRVGIAARCAIFSFDHGITPDLYYGHQELTTKGPVIIENDVWLGYGVIVLSGVRIGKDAVIGAGSVVTKDVPAGAIAVGVPARIVRMRADLRPTERAAAESVKLKDDSDVGHL